ncbi:precorrin-6A reductase [Kribbella monticola]|uniref:precorrin-6A reductase n=1 Tax=Kribbella monticola TaxID=2185285 RepID=UPI000DD49727|nr:precorrin-6A reductase [Kribbella monticola]
MKVLLLGGTGEARRLAELLAGEPEIEVVSSLAGRTAEARLPEGAVRRGGFGGVEGLIDWLNTHQIDVVVDATHPFAATMTEHAAQAARLTDVELLVLRRAGWREQAGDRWTWVGSPEEAARILPRLGKRAFLTIGRQGLSAFAAAAVPQTTAAAAPAPPASGPAPAGVWILARCVDPPEPVPDWCELLLDRGPYVVQSELELLRERRIDVLVTKDSGGPMTSAKLEAARALGIPVVVIERPPLPAGVTVVETVDQVVRRLTDRR